MITSDEKVGHNTAVQRVIAAVTAEKGRTETESEETVEANVVQ